MKDSKADEIWTMNHHLYLDEQEPEALRNLPRGITRLFEVHKKDWFLRKEIPAAEKYWEWLQQPHPFPIYTIEPIPEIPAAVDYPREALRILFEHLWRGDKQQEYYSSSVAMMFALAIYEGFDRIELYGIEMATGTEYADQRPGGEYWIGYANGRGIDVILHPRCHLCDAVVYGYEAVPHITKERMAALVAHYAGKSKEADEVAKAALQKFNSGQTKDHREAMAAVAWNAMYLGAYQMLEVLIEQDGTYVSAQHLEEYENKKTLEAERFKADVNVLRAEYNLLTSFRKGSGRSRKKWDEFIDARAHMYAYDGARQVVHLLREECKLRRPVHELRMQIAG